MACVPGQHQRRCACLLAVWGDGLWVRATAGAGCNGLQGKSLAPCCGGRGSTPQARDRKSWVGAAANGVGRWRVVNGALLWTS